MGQRAERTLPSEARDAPHCGEKGEARPSAVQDAHHYDVATEEAHQTGSQRNFRLEKQVARCNAARVHKAREIRGTAPYFQSSERAAIAEGTGSAVREDTLIAEDTTCVVVEGTACVVVGDTLVIVGDTLVIAGDTLVIARDTLVIARDTLVIAGDILAGVREDIQEKQVVVGGFARDRHVTLTTLADVGGLARDHHATLTTSTGAGGLAKDRHVTLTTSADVGGLAKDRHVTLTSSANVAAIVVGDLVH